MYLTSQRFAIPKPLLASTPSSTDDDGMAYSYAVLPTLLIPLLLSRDEDAEGSVAVAVLTEPPRQTVRTRSYFEDADDINDSDNNNGAMLSILLPPPTSALALTNENEVTSMRRNRLSNTNIGITQNNANGKFAKLNSNTLICSDL